MRGASRGTSSTGSVSPVDHRGRFPETVGLKLRVARPEVQPCDVVAVDDAENLLNPLLLESDRGGRTGDTELVLYVPLHTPRIH